MTLREQIDEAVQAIKMDVDTAPEIGIILGTGLGGLADEIEGPSECLYENIPHFPLSTVESHTGRLVFGTLGDKKVVAMQGRFHHYEGYSLQEVTFPVRVMKALGVKTLIVSNAAGGLDPLYAKGDLMLITDHINLMGGSPLIGRNDEELGPRFPDMSEPYSEELTELAGRIAIENGMRLHRGVYVAVTGPNLETRAEYRFLRMIGADAVGMSTVPEVIVAVQSGMKVMAVSGITDECDPDNLEPVALEEILRVAAELEPKLGKIVRLVIENL
ncbi:purine-nucleoside phosphorylase [Candidatus Hydrogenedentota bacterium]